MCVGLWREKGRKERNKKKKREQLLKNIVG